MLATGRIADQWVLGQMIYTGELLTITIKAALTIDTFVNFTWFGLAGSIAVWFFALPLYAFVGPQIGIGKELLGMNENMFTQGSFWLGIIIVPIIANFRDYIWRL